MTDTNTSIVFYST